MYKCYPGLGKKVNLGASNLVFQSSLYKNRDFFTAEVNKIPARYTMRQSYMHKIQEAIDYKTPTVALAFYNLAKGIPDQGVIDPLLQNTLKIANEPSDATFLRRAFGEDPYNVDIPQLGEYYYYLIGIEEPTDKITDAILERIGDETITKYSDFLGLSLVLKNDHKVINGLRDQLDTFSGKVLYKYLMVFANDINSSGIFPDNFKKEFKTRYKYFAEGIRKWAFVDKGVTNKELRKDVRSLALKDNYKYMTTKSNKIMLDKLTQLYEYTTGCYIRIVNEYKFQF